MSAELPSSYRSLYQEAIAQMAAGNTEQAIESMSRIVNRLCRLRPETLQRRPNLQETLVAAWRNAVEFLRWEKRYDEAIALCETASAHLPDPSSSRTRIASLMIERGEVDAGLAQFRQLAEERQDFGSWADLGAEYSNQGRYEEAQACYHTALSLASSNDEAAVVNVGLFRTLQEAGRTEEALSAWNMAVVLGPELADRVVLVYEWLIEHGDLERARQYLARERNAIRQPFYQGLIDWQAGAQGAAQGKWRQVLHMEIGEEGTGAEEKLEAALRLGEFQRAIELAKAWRSQGRVLTVDIVIYAGIAHLLLGNAREAQEHFEQATLRLRRGWPSRDTIPARYWALVASLASDPGVLQSAAVYFDRGEADA